LIVLNVGGTDHVTVVTAVPLNGIVTVAVNDEPLPERLSIQKYAPPRLADESYTSCPIAASTLFPIATSQSFPGFPGLVTVTVPAVNGPPTGLGVPMSANAAFGRAGSNVPQGSAVGTGCESSTCKVSKPLDGANVAACPPTRR